MKFSKNGGVLWPPNKGMAELLRASVRKVDFYLLTCKISVAVWFQLSVKALAFGVFQERGLIIMLIPVFDLWRG